PSLCSVKASVLLWSSTIESLPATGVGSSNCTCQSLRLSWWLLDWSGPWLSRRNDASAPPVEGLVPGPVVPAGGGAGLLPSRGLVSGTPTFNWYNWVRFQPLLSWRKLLRPLSGTTRVPTAGWLDALLPDAGAGGVRVRWPQALTV